MGQKLPLERRIVVRRFRPSRWLWLHNGFPIEFGQFDRGGLFGSCAIGLCIDDDRLVFADVIVDLGVFNGQHDVGGVERLQWVEPFVSDVDCRIGRRRISGARC